MTRGHGYRPVRLAVQVPGRLSPSDDELRLHQIENYDLECGIEGDAYAFLDTTLRHVANGAPCVGISAMTGDAFRDVPFFITAREARCLAAQLIREADRLEDMVDGHEPWPDAPDTTEPEPTS